MIHGCARTFSSTADLRRAKQLLEQHVHDPQVEGLLAEYDLCLVWEKLLAQRHVSIEEADYALNQWQLDWNDFVASENGKYPSPEAVRFKYFLVD